MKKTIALLTDFGLNDNYVGIMKGVILKINPRVQLVDICHSIKPQCVVQGALTLKSSYRYFPKKTIFLCVVDPGVGSKREAIIVKTKDYVFVAPDNGILSLALDTQASREIYAITNIEEKHLAAFKGNPTITCKGKTISHVPSSYAQVKKGQSLGIIGSKGYLEISVNMGSAAKKFNARNGNRIEVLFY